MDNKTFKTYKGFDSNLKCKGFQYEVGKTYTLPEGENPIVCNRGFHAIAEDNSPLGVFDYYPPSIDGRPSRYCEVEVGGDTKRADDKIVGSKISIGAEIGIPGIAKAHIEWVKRNLIDDNEHKATNTGYCSSASNTGDSSSASNTGYCSSASNTGKRSSASNTGDSSSASNTGYCSSASNTGYDSKARGALGCAIVLVERGEYDERANSRPIINIKAAIIDGEHIKADTWYKLVNGEFTEVTND